MGPGAPQPARRPAGPLPPPAVPPARSAAPAPAAALLQPPARGSWAETCAVRPPGSRHPGLCPAGRDLSEKEGGRPGPRPWARFPSQRGQRAGLSYHPEVTEGAGPTLTPGGRKESRKGSVSRGGPQARECQASLTALFPSLQPAGCRIISLRAEGLKIMAISSHLMRRVDSLAKSLMLGGIGGRRRRTEDEMAGWHHQLDGHPSYAGNSPPHATSRPRGHPVTHSWDGQCHPTL